MLKMFHLSILLLLLIKYTFCENIIFPKDISKYEGNACVSSDGFNGTCMQISECENSQKLFNKSDMCLFVKDKPTYCCVDMFEAKITDFKDLLNDDPPKKLRPIEDLCQMYHHPSFKIFGGGRRTLLDEQPHMAAIGWTNTEGGVDWRCGGSVVSTRFILTAAHCTSNNGIPPNKVRTGDLNLLITENDTNPIDFQVTDIYVHPDFKPNVFYHDIALVKITPEFPLEEKNKPACIWPHLDIPAIHLTGMGYGTFDFGGPWSNELFQGVLDLMANKECSAKVPINPSIPQGIMRSQLCAQDPKNIMDTCQGDSGGPLQFISESGDVERPMIVGITSFGQNCAGIAPGVYTRVSEYVDWLEDILFADSRNVSVTSKKIQV